LKTGRSLEQSLDMLKQAKAIVKIAGEGADITNLRTLLQNQTKFLDEYNKLMKTTKTMTEFNTIVDDMAKIIDAPQLRNLAHFSPDAVVS
jgi:hypothetical protein